MIRPDVNIFDISMYSNNVCGCDFCWNSLSCQPNYNLSGPHDLNCICPICLRDFDRFSDSTVTEMYGERYSNENLDPFPIWEDIESALPLTQEEIDRIDILLSAQYDAPPDSPTNQEMHALNGNILSREIEDLIYPPVEHYKNRRQSYNPAVNLYNFAKDLKTDRNISIRTNILNSAKRYADAQYAQYRADKTGKVAYSTQGNITKTFQPKGFNLFPGDSTRVKLPNFPTGPGKTKISPSKDNIPPKQPTYQDAPKRQDNPIYNHEHKEIKQDPFLPPTQSITMPSMGVLNPPTGPTNKDMHSMNGNINYGPFTQKKTARLARRKIRRKIKRKLKNNNFNYRPAIRKSAPPKIKGEKSAVAKYDREKKLALRYAKFLKNPALPPPRLGSSGSLPTKLLHGFYELTVNMANPNFGNNAALTNCTDLLVFLTPIMTSCSTNTVSNFSTPICINVANGPTITLNGSTNNTWAGVNYANNTALLGEAGNTASSLGVPQARFLGGHVSIKCRCPVSTTAAPYLFGGLLPSVRGNGTNSTAADPTKQLNSYSTSQVRSLLCSQEIEAMQGSAVYLPSSSTVLDFNNFVCNYTSTNSIPMAPVPYIGMTGCPTTATVTIYVSSYFEIQQTPDNCNYGGWNKGPKLSTEDIFDNLPNINPVKLIALNLGSKVVGGSSGTAVMAQMKAMLDPTPPTIEQKFDNLKVEMARLSSMYKELTIQLEDEEDEKYISSPIQNYQSLSKSTIDLALSLKEKLTPGSVTSKTNRITQL